MYTHRTDTKPVLNDVMTRKAKQKGKQAGDTGASDNVATLPISPGQKLRQARKKSGLTQAEVAERLFLHAGFVEHLEADEFEQLPGPTFVKGYIKSYCRLVGLSPDPIVALYKEHRPDQEFAESVDGTKPVGSKVGKMAVPHGEAMPNFKEPAQARRKTSYLPHLIGILLVSAGVIYVATDGELGKPQMALSRLLSDGVSPQEAAGILGQSGEAPSVPLVAGSVSNDSTQDAMLPSISTGQSSADAGADSDPAASLVTSSLSTPLLDGDPRVIRSAEAVSGMAVSYQIQLPTLAADSQETHRLKLNFLKKGHVLVRDGLGAVAHNQTHARGAEVRVALLGRPPYVLSLSEPAIVSVYFDGEPLKLPASAP